MYLSGSVELGLLEEHLLWVVDVSCVVDVGIEGNICSRVFDVDNMGGADMEVTCSVNMFR